MAAQVLLGIPAIITALGALATKIMLILFTAKVARLAYVLAIIGLGSLAVDQLLGLLGDSISSLLSNMPSEFASFATFLPSNTITCLTVIISVEIGCIMYSLTMRALDMQLQV